MTKGTGQITRLRHPGSGREALLVCTPDWLDSEPVSLAGERYVLFAGSARSTATSHETARCWIDAGASYLCAWGTSADDVEEAFDHASFLDDLGPPLGFTLMTTSHARCPLEEALWFAFYNALQPGELSTPLNAVVIVIDEPALARACEQWVSGNRG